MKIRNVTTGVCQWRATNGKPSLFVSFERDGEKQYEYFELVFAMYARFYELQAAELCE